MASIDHIVSIRSPVSGHVCGFPLRAIVNNVAMNLCVAILLRGLALSSFAYNPQRRDGRIRY